MRKTTNTPILVTIFVIGLGFLAQVADSSEQYEGPILKIWNAYNCIDTQDLPLGDRDARGDVQKTYI